MQSAPLVKRVLLELLKTAHQKAVGFCTSRQLRSHMDTSVRIATPVKAEGIVFVHEYWAIYHHIGRANMPVIRVKTKKFLAWFPNARDDPRLINGEYPVHRSEVRRLDEVMSKEEFKAAILARKLVLSPISPKRGGAASFQGNPFFGSEAGQGMAGMEDRARNIAVQECYKEMEQFLRETGLKKKKMSLAVAIKGFPK